MNHANGRTRTAPIRATKLQRNQVKKPHINKLPEQKNMARIIRKGSHEFSGAPVTK